MLCLPEILCKQQVLCTAKSNHNKAIPEVYVPCSHLGQQNATAEQACFVPTFRVLAEVCIEEEEVKAHTPSSFALLFPGSFV